MKIITHATSAPVLTAYNIKVWTIRVVLLGDHKVKLREWIVPKAKSIPAEETSALAHEEYTQSDGDHRISRDRCTIDHIVEPLRGATSVNV